MKMIKIPWNFDGELISEDTCLHAYNSDSYENKLFISSKHFKAVQIYNGNLEDEFCTESYIVTIFLNKGSDIIYADDGDEISYYFTHDELGKETAHKLVDSIISKINS